MDLFTTISFFISEVSDISETLALMVWLIFARKKQTYQILGAFFVVSASLKLLTLITAKKGIHNMPLYHLLAVTEIVLVYCFYSKLMFNKVYVLGAVLLFLLNAVNSIFIQSIFTFNSWAWSMNMVVLMIIGITYLFKLYNNENDDSPLELRPNFIITAGWLIYASGSLFTYLLGIPILSGKAAGFFHNAWTFQCVSNLFKNVLISYGLWRARLD
jgi:hypothetical protein